MNQELELVEVEMPLMVAWRMVTDGHTRIWRRCAADGRGCWRIRRQWVDDFISHRLATGVSRSRRRRDKQSSRSSRVQRFIPRADMKDTKRQAVEKARSTTDELPELGRANVTQESGIGFGLCPRCRYTVLGTRVNVCCPQCGYPICSRQIPVPHRRPPEPTVRTRRITRRFSAENNALVWTAMDRPPPLAMYKTRF